MSSHLELARKVLRAEAAGILATMEGLDNSFDKIVDAMLAIKGKLLITGTGKSGHIARKLAATLASTGTQAFFVHPTEAGHGDLGMVGASDGLLALSFSGESAELKAIFAFAKKLSIPFFLMTGDPGSTLAQAAMGSLAITIDREACPLNLAPTTSTTAMLAAGDALAMALMAARGFTSKDFAATHPAGALGRRLLLRVSDLMVTSEKMPSVSSASTVAEAIVEMNAKRLGMTTVNSEGGFGVFTSDELQSILAACGDINKLTVGEFMQAPAATVEPDQPADEAMSLMHDNNLTSLLVIENGKLCGVLELLSTTCR